MDRLSAQRPGHRESAGETSKYAEEGTQAHEVCETALRHKLKDWENGKPFNLLTDWVHQPTLTEMVNAANQYVEFVYLQWGLYLHQPEVFIEQEVDVSQWVPGGFGTCDCLLIGDGILHIIDFKYGQGVPVSPERNPQLMYYALGAYALFEGIEEVSTVRLSIVQPRMQEEPQTWVVSLADLLTWHGRCCSLPLRWHGRARASSAPAPTAASARHTPPAGHGRTSTARWPDLSLTRNPLHSLTRSWASGCRSWKVWPPTPGIWKSTPSRR